MVDEQVPVSTPAPTQVAEVKEEVIETPAKTFTEDDINRIVKERLDRERKKYADYNDLKLAKTKLDEIEMANKSKEEQALAKLQALEAKIAESQKAVQAAELREKKRAALESANLGIPKDVTVSEMLDMVTGDTEEAIDSAITRLKKLFPVSKAQGIGTQVSEVVPTAAKTIDESIGELTAKMRDPKLTAKERDNMVKQVIKLNNQKIRESMNIK